MEHECSVCQHHWVDHTAGLECPKCGSSRIIHWDADRERDWEAQDAYEVDKDQDD